MVHIQDLPIELLRLILSFIADPEDEPFLKLPDRADQSAKAKGGNANELERDDQYDDDDADEYENLRNICLVSRRFRELAQPLLFRYFDDDGLAGDLSKTISFAKTIYRCPHLGKLVQDISILPIPFCLGGPRQLTVEDSEFFKGAIQDLQLADQEEAWISAMEKSDLGVFGALLVNKTPNLRGLHLPGGQFSMKPFTHLFSRNPSFLSDLESLWIECEDEFSGYNIASYQEFLTLPKLVFPTFENGDLLDASFPSTWAPGTLMTEQVAFHRCHIDAGSIRKFMRACKKLKSFTYQNFSLDPHDQRTPSTRATAEFNAAQAHEAALLHKNTLEHFHLEFARDPWDFENPEEYLSSRVKIGSFRDFVVLETIFLPHALLPPHPQFPRSLKTLHITDCNSSIRDLVQNIAIDCKNGLYPDFTDFKVLAIDITRPIKLSGQRIPPGKTPEQCFLSLQGLFKGTKVDFQILPYKIPDFDEYDDSDLDYEDYEEYPLGAGVPGMDRMPGLFDLIMQRALQDPDFTNLRSHAASDNSWETDDND
ncbi:uncharacterized protein N7473_001304 [Penicillium subrubescens]|uniref:Uncharacterized protein n=1 Tax=Penicillium subrubescens TaxID=1316194 RepID=A0A1Q5T8B1_9EURO|nr:uncharacterized protein N7473_001304 [Penicillium subrubescens]KAJ5912001.1 hypothetical protein N7473_001304 [Penicillium subrubescens]OKO96461.1 hypothetical protein PENSUB_10636 [Penicillium subrubescens]